MHRRQITFTGRPLPGLPRGVDHPGDRRGAGPVGGAMPCHDGAFTVEACTGWRFVVEELQAAGWQAYLAEPAETATCAPRRSQE